MLPSDSSKPTADLSALAARADRDIQTLEAQQALAAAPRESRVGARRTLAALGAVLGVSAALYAAWPRWFGASDAALRASLVQMVEAARGDIESRRSAAGEWPPSLSDPHLADVVQYERTAQGYRLVAKAHTITVVMDEKGVLR